MHRVAVYVPPSHPAHGGGVEGEAVCAFRLGGIEDGVHNAAPGHAPVPFDEFIDSLVEQAGREFPEEGVRVVVEVLVDNGDDTASWVAEEEFDPEEHKMTSGGVRKERLITVNSKQRVGSATPPLDQPAAPAE